MNKSHTHHNGENESSTRIGWAFFLNLGFTVIEFVGGWLTNSTAIMADAVHDLGDCLSIGLGWLLNVFSAKKQDAEFTYGYRRFSLLGALINSAVLIAGSLWVLSISLPRLAQPEMPAAEGMLGLAILGVAVNGFAAYKLSQGKTLNERVLNWHLLEDVLGWAAVLIVAVVLLFVEWPILDPILSIGFTLFILFNVVKTLWSTGKIFLQGIPTDISAQEIKNKLLTVDRVIGIHHFHLWSLDGERNVLTAHVKVSDGMSVSQQLDIKERIAQVLRDYNLEHTTIELEFTNESCRDEQEETI